MAYNLYRQETTARLTTTFYYPNTLFNSFTRATIQYYLYYESPLIISARILLSDKYSNIRHQFPRYQIFKLKKFLLIRVHKVLLRQVTIALVPIANHNNSTPISVSSWFIEFYLITHLNQLNYRIFPIRTVILLDPALDWAKNKLVN